MSTPDILSPSVSSENFTREEVQAVGEVKHKPFMYGIMCPDGTAYLDEICVDSNDSQTLVDVIEEQELEGHTVVALYSASTVESLKAENAALLSRVERLRGDLQYIAKQWPDSFAAYRARAALKEATDV